MPANKDAGWQSCKQKKYHFLADIVKFFLALLYFVKNVETFVRRNVKKNLFTLVEKVHSTVMGLCKGIDFIKKKIVGEGKEGRSGKP